MTFNPAQFTNLGFGSKTAYYKHQLFNLTFHLGREKSADWSDCGTGKSLTALGKFIHLYLYKKATVLLIVCPLSVMESWVEEAEKHTLFKATKLLGSITSKINKLQDNSQIYIVTYDSIAGREDHRLFKALLQKHFDMIILDEATHIKNWGAKRTRALCALCDSIKYSISLSGTFIPQHPEDVLTMYRVMDGGKTFGKDIYVSKNQYFENVGYNFPDWQLRKDKEEEFKNKLWVNAIRTKKEDCLDLPPKIFKHYYCYMTTEQQNKYKEISTSVKVSYLEATLLGNKWDNPSPLGNKWDNPSPLVSIIKLQELASGFLYTNSIGVSSMRIERYGWSKTNLLREVLTDIGDEKVIIYYNMYQEAEDIIFNALVGKKVAIINGSLTQEERKDNLDKFRNTDCQYLVAQVEAGGYGITLTQANHILYYSLPFSLNDFLQSQDRIHRIGQTKTCIYHILMTKNTVDTKTYKLLEKNIDVVQEITREKDRLIKFIGDDDE